MRPCLVIALLGPVAWCGDAHRQPLVIHVLDYVQAPTEMLDEALGESREIFRQAAIELQWTICRPFIDDGDRCDPPKQKSDPVLQILKHSPDKRMASSGAFGCVLRDRQTAFGVYVFYDRVKWAADAAPFRASVLLGMVITHELGHFFGLADSLGGIMLSSFRRVEMMQTAAGTLTFGEGEARRLRASIAACPNRSTGSESGCYLAAQGPK